MISFVSIALFKISIHALREEGDTLATSSVEKTANFYPRPPRGGRHRSLQCSWQWSRYFYPRPPRGGRRRSGGGWKGWRDISIHALREEGDTMALSPAGYKSDFYPRPPRGGRHVSRVTGLARFRISIHALREEGDPTVWPYALPLGHFYPRPPRGGRRGGGGTQTHKYIFLSTPSARRATGQSPVFFTVFCISIHALREEGDHPLGNVFYGQNAFLSTPSARRATYHGTSNPALLAFLSTPSARRATV